MSTLIPPITPYNWYQSEISLSVAILDVYVNSVETKIKSSIIEFEENKKTVITDEQPENNYARIFEVYEGLDSETFDLTAVFRDYYPALQRRSAFITLYSFLEHELDKLCVLFKKTNNYNIDFRELKGMGIIRSKKYLELVAILPVESINDKYSVVRSIQKIRNLIVHNDGKLYDIDGKPKEMELKITKQCEFLSGDDEVIIKEGYLRFVLNAFADFFKAIDDLIRYNKEQSIYPDRD